MRNENFGDVRNLVQAGVVHEVHFHSEARVPAELPAAPEVLVDRAAEQARLGELLRGSVAGVGISGLSGVGKSVLALHCLSRAAEQFGDGQIYFDFNAQGRPVDVVDAAQHCLRALGVPADQIPGSLGAAVARLRSETHGRRVVVFLDNVADLAAVRELRLSSPGSLLVFTTHRDVRELAFDGVEAVPLSTFEAEHALELLRQVCGDGRIDADGEGSDRLVELCGGLAIALRIVGARLVRQPSLRPSRLADRLADDERRLDLLVLNTDAVMRNTLALVVGDLPPAQADLYRLLGLVPGPTFSAAAVAALADLPLHTAEDLLLELQSSNLLEENDQEQYRFHDLVGLHARKLADDDAALLRLVGWYRQQGAFADRAVTDPSRLRVGEELVTGTNPFSAKSGLEWLERERLNVIALVRLCHQREWDQAVVSFCDGPLWALHNQHKNYEDTLGAFELGVGSAQRSGDLRAEARMRSVRARLWMELSRFDEARQEATRARDVAQRSGHRRVLASALEFLGQVHLKQDAWDEAIGLFDQALAINEEIGRPRGMAIQEYLIGKALHGRGDHEESLRHLDTALELLAGFPDDRRTPSRVRTTIVRVLQARGQHAEAVDRLRQVVEETRDRGASFDLAEPLELLGSSLAETGDTEGARTCLLDAIAIYEQARHPSAARLRERLKE